MTSSQRARFRQSLKDAGFVNPDLFTKDIQHPANDEYDGNGSYHEHYTTGNPANKDEILVMWGPRQAGW